MTGELVQISGADAGPILAEAFAADPAMEFFTGSSRGDAQAPLRSQILRILVRVHELSRQSLWGWRAENRIMGCALVEDRPNRLRHGVAMFECCPLPCACQKKRCPGSTPVPYLAKGGAPTV